MYQQVNEAHPNPIYGQPGYYPPVNIEPYGQSYNGDVKNPYEGGRFKPKKTINDPIFLILFVLQVRSRLHLQFVSPSQWLMQWLKSPLQSYLVLAPSLGYHLTHGYRKAGWAVAWAKPEDKQAPLLH